MAMPEEEWTRIVSAKSNRWQLNLKEIFRYQDLLLLFVRRDFVSMYKQTLLGPTWFFIQPLFTAFTYYIVLTRMGGMQTGNLPPLLFYISGITVWNYFRDCLTLTSSTFVTNAGMFEKVYFPRAIVPISVVISQFIRFVIQMILLTGFIVYYHYFDDDYKFSLSVYALMLPLIILAIAILSLSLGMLISAWTTKYRDLQLLVNFGLQLLMFFSAVVVPISQVNNLSGTAATLIRYNPIAQYVDAFKISVLGVGDIDWGGFGYAALVTLILFFWSVFVFNKTEKNFIDTV